MKENLKSLHYKVSAFSPCPPKDTFIRKQKRYEFFLRRAADQAAKRQLHTGVRRQALRMQGRCRGPAEPHGDIALRPGFARFISILER